MARTSISEFALIGLILSGHRTGYAMKREVDEALSHFWNESSGNIYPTLERLVQKQFVTRSREEGNRRPDRLEYSVTDHGKQAFEDWLGSAIAPIKPRNELALRIYFGFLAEDLNLQDLISDNRRSFEKTLAFLELTSTELPPDSGDGQISHMRMTLDLGRRVNEALICWCDDVSKRMHRI